MTLDKPKGLIESLLFLFRCHSDHEQALVPDSEILRKMSTHKVAEEAGGFS